MFNTTSKITVFTVMSCLLITLSCDKDEKLSFSETEITKEKETFVEIIIPKANGKSKTAKNINDALTNFACDVLNIDSAKNKTTTINQSIDAFNAAYINFNETLLADFDTKFPRWEALIDGEVSYQNEALVCVSMNGSITTGAASSSLKFKFFNFDLSNGKSLKTKDIVNNMKVFKALVKKYYDKELLTTYTSVNNTTDNFKLPETIGFNEDGVIIVYDNFELGNFTKQLVEFTIPYTVVNQYLNY
ncbi:DUF3298 domain-containing protein [Olleya sp. YSTF-M6]|uniref:DUF3298 domain-containing protein n=1 Tax=Olleya sediminilitoris TaxID=2795739 RepID=A0ABS1WGM9_9FLAO|nr:MULTISPECIES: DUF3298 domain-containing protein [Olleya]MBL7558284.1 DUF3298 domain-containing protein [Olleya sediminilitoris]